MRSKIVAGDTEVGRGHETEISKKEKQRREATRTMRCEAWQGETVSRRRTWSKIVAEGTEVRRGYETQQKKTVGVVVRRISGRNSNTSHKERRKATA